jgi:hypothetical protein
MPRSGRAGSSGAPTSATTPAPSASPPSALVAEFVKLFPEDGAPVSDHTWPPAQSRCGSLRRRARYARPPAGRPGRVVLARARGRGTRRNDRVVRHGMDAPHGERRRGARLLSRRDRAHRTRAVGRAPAEHLEGASGGTPRRWTCSAAANPRSSISYRVSRRQRRGMPLVGASGPTNSRSRAARRADGGVPARTPAPPPAPRGAALACDRVSVCPRSTNRTTCRHSCDSSSS